MEAEIQAAEIEAPLEILSPGEQRLPLVFASPHSGSRYPPDFVEASALDRLMLRRSEDCFVHDIFSEANTMLLGSSPNESVRFDFDRAEKSFSDVLHFLGIDLIGTLFSRYWFRKKGRRA